MSGILPRFASESLVSRLQDETILLQVVCFLDTQYLIFIAGIFILFVLDAFLI